MTAICASVIHLCYVRFTRIDAVGEPIAGPNNVYVIDDPISLAINPDILTGETKDQKSGCDKLIATYRGQDLVKRFTLELELAKLAPGLEEMLTGGDVVLNDESEPIGVDFPVACDFQTPYNVMEAWQDLWDCDHQPSDPYPYRRWIFPSSRWTRADETAQNDFGVQKFNGFTVGNANWGIGIYGDLTSPVGPAGQWIYDTVLPTAACGYQSQELTT